ncbi:MAG: tRNA uridine-5-carboxymethylaminomethyl(34) synthesis GTPase MnmE [Acutalibacteraceae bacterium]|nr:tRNA uridine-5-carboxymethylaminomethyl(34) synthesis GTPase MnmE [Acutalibacteraceae bacterium]
MNTFTDTIAAISTANGPGGIGVIRISGSESLKIADKIFKSVSNKKVCEMKGYTASYGSIYDGDEKIDEVVLTVFRLPHSYTGENVVEISCHGGMYVTKQVLRTVINNGAVPAKAGEFTQRAFLNGKMDLSEAEAVMDIISAKGKTEARAALACREGKISKEIFKINSLLVNSAAHLSAWADYPEEDIPQVEDENLKKDLLSAKEMINNLLKNYDAGMVLKRGVDTIIVGKPNVGKSTLMNQLTGYEKSIVTNIPGTTRDIIEETVVLGDVTLNLSDTAGLRETDNLVEKIGVERARKKIETSGLILAVFDATESLNDEDINLLKNIKGLPAVAIINKTDCDGIIDINFIKTQVENIVFISAKSGEGVEDLVRIIEKITGTTNFDPSVATLATERQRDCAVRALNALDEAINSIELGFTLDATTVSIEDAIQSILEITGERASEVVVDSVFKHFCVGK